MASYEYNKPIPDIIKRKWLCDTTITTSAGIFDCLQLQMFWDYNNDNLHDSGSTQVTQYFSEKGLIQEEVNNPKLVFSGGGFGSSRKITKLVHGNF